MLKAKHLPYLSNQTKWHTQFYWRGAAIRMSNKPALVDPGFLYWSDSEEFSMGGFYRKSSLPVFIELWSD